MIGLRRMVAFGTVLALAGSIFYIMITLAITPSGADLDVITREQNEESSQTIVCPEATEFIPPERPPVSMTYILADRSNSYRDWTEQALQFAGQEVLPAALSPGDCVVAAYIGSDSADPESTFFEGCVDPGKWPEVDPVSELELLSTPVGSAETTTGKLEEARQADKVAATNAERLNDHYCDIRRFNDEWQHGLRAWEGERDTLVARFLAAAAPHFSNVEVYYQQETKLMEALFVASRVLQRASQDGYQNLRLLVLSDFTEERYAPPKDLSLNFTNVNIVIALCAPLERCLEAEDSWRETFESSHARSVEFLMVQESTVENVVRAMEGD